MTTFAYPYDPTGDATTNVVSGEVHNLANYTNAYRCIIPLQAPFYRDDILIKHVQTGRTLYEGLDYYFGYYYDELSDTVKQAVYGGLIFFDRALAGSIRIERYHTVGGFYLQRKKDIDAFLAKEPMQDPRNIDFSAIMKWPRAVTPISVPETLAQAIEIDPVAKALDGLDQKLRSIAVTQKAQFEDIFNQLAALSTKIRLDKFLTHYFGTDPHQVTYAQLSALGKDETAKSTLTAYGYTLAELIVVINQMGITPENAARWYELIGGVFEGRISITEGPTFAIQNELGTSLINITTGQIQILAKSNVNVIADSDKDSQDVSGQLQAGNNTLSVHSNKTSTSKNSAIYNGYYLIHVGNIADFVTTDKTATKLDLITANTAYVKLTGKGEAGNPLTGMVTFPSASTVEAGLIQLTDSTQSSSTTLGVTGKALFDAKTKIDGYALASRKVNGKALTSNITLTKAGFGLGNVNNTRNHEKPASTAFLAALTNKSPLNHTHNLGDLLNVPVASPTVSGITQLQDTIDSTTTKAASPVAGRIVDSVIAVHEDTFADKIDTINLPIVEWGGYKDLTTPSGGVFVSSIVGFVLTLTVIRFTDQFGWNTSGSVVDLTGHPNAVMYLYVDNGVVSASTTRYADNDDESYVGYVNTNATTITNISISPVYRIINNRELLLHMEQVNAHGHKWNDAGYFGLENIQNKTLSDLVTQPTFADVFNSWYRFSHSGNTFPANASELNNWTYISATDTIKYTIDSATYIGFVSPTPMGDFIFDAAVSSTDIDDDSIGLVIGFYKDPSTGKEYTLSLIRTLSRDTPAMTYSIRLVYNFLQNDQWEIELAGAKMSYGWSTVGECRIRAERVGSIYTLSMWGFASVNGGAQDYSRVLDLDSDPRLAVFKGSTRYGYACHSQNSSSFRSIIRPDEDGRNFYASEQALRTMLSTFESNVAFTTGTIAHGQTVPLPVGFTYAQCSIIAVPYNQPSPSATLPIKKIRCSIDPSTGLASIQASNDGTTWIAGTAYYYLFGVK